MWYNRNIGDRKMNSTLQAIIQAIVRATKAGNIKWAPTGEIRGKGTDRELRGCTGKYGNVTLRTSVLENAVGLCLDSRTLSSNPDAIPGEETDERTLTHLLRLAQQSIQERKPQQSGSPDNRVSLWARRREK